MREKGGPAQSLRSLRRLRCSGYGAVRRWRDHDVIAVAAVRPAGIRTHQPPARISRRKPRFPVPQHHAHLPPFSSLRQCGDVTGRNLALDVSGRLL